MTTKTAAVFEQPDQQPISSERSHHVPEVAVNIGFWSAAAAALFTVAFAVAALAVSTPAWDGIEAYARAFEPVQLTSAVPALLLIPAMILLMACLHYYAPPEKRVLTLAGITCIAVYAAIIASNYYLQLFVVRLNIQQGNLEGLSLLAMPNLRSAFFAFEAIGYSFLSLATLIASPIFVGGRLERWIRRLFILNGIIGVYGVVALFDRPMLVFAGLGLWSLAFPVSMVLVALLFRRTRQVSEKTFAAPHPEDQVRFLDRQLWRKERRE